MNQMSAMNDAKPIETIEVETLTPSCDGGTQGHPKVFLHIKPEAGAVVCPYCSRHYVLKPGAKPAGHH